MDEKEAEKIISDGKLVADSYTFLKALMADYSTCKTDLARGGIFKAIEVLIGKLEDLHSRCIDAAVYYKSNLAIAKEKIPKTKEEIARILNEFGFYELEEVRDVSCHNPKTVPLPPKVYAELYEKYYGKLPSDSADNATDDSKKESDEYKAFVKTKRICNKTLTKLAIEEAKLENSASTSDATSIAKTPPTKGKTKKKTTKSGSDSK